MIAREGRGLHPDSIGERSSIFASLRLPLPAQLDASNFNKMTDSIPSIPSQHADRNSSRQCTAAKDAKAILGQERPINHPTSYSASLGDLCAFAVNSSFTANFAWVQHMLHPRYVGAEDIEDDGEGFDEKMTRLADDLKGQFAESAKLEIAIKANLKGPSYAL